MTLEPIPVPAVAATGDRARTEVAEALAEEIGLAAPTAAPGRRAAVEVGQAVDDERMVQPAPQLEVADLPAPRAGAEVLEALADEREIAVASVPTQSAVDRAGAEVAAALGAERAVEIAVRSHPAGARAREEVAASLGATIVQAVPELSSGEGTAGAVRDRAMADVAMALGDERDILPNGSVASPGEQRVADVPVSAPVTLEAIEIDGEDNYFAGGGVEGATVRVFVDGALAGETTVADGRWLVEAAGTLTKDEQRVRAEMLEDDGPSPWRRRTSSLKGQLARPCFRPPATPLTIGPRAKWHSRWRISHARYERGHGSRCNRSCRSAGRGPDARAERADAGRVPPIMHTWTLPKLSRTFRPSNLSRRWPFRRRYRPGPTTSRSCRGGHQCGPGRRARRRHRCPATAAAATPGDRAAAEVSLALGAVRLLRF